MQRCCKYKKVFNNAKAKLAMPIHWAMFTLAFHAWDEPIQRFIQQARAKDLPYIKPMIGQSFHLDDFPHQEWWNA